MVERERGEGPLVVVDGGGSLTRGRVAPDELPQRQRKARLIADGLVLGGIDGAALSQADWQLGGDFVRQTVEATGLPVLAANLTCDGGRPWPGSRVVERGGRRIALVGLTEGEVPGCAVSDPVEALRVELDGLGERDLTVLLMPQRNLEAARIAEARLPVDLVVDGGSGRRTQRPDTFGDAWLVAIGNRGKQLGLVEATWKPGGEGWAAADAAADREAEVERLEARLERAKERLASADERSATRYRAQVDHFEAQLADARAKLDAAGEASARRTHELALSTVELDAGVPDHPATHALVEAAKAEITALEAGEEVPLSSGRLAPGDSPYAGSDTCASCHAAEHAQWRSTGHARAWATLVEDERHLDRDCWSCHVTGAGQAGGPEAPAAVGGLRDVQCEACHGPARAHLADPTGTRPVRTPEITVCTGCHDAEQDMGRFDAETYWPKVRHDTLERVGPPAE